MKAGFAVVGAVGAVILKFGSALAPTRISCEAAATAGFAAVTTAISVSIAINVITNDLETGDGSVDFLLTLNAYTIAESAAVFTYQDTLEKCKSKP